MNVQAIAHTQVPPEPKPLVKKSDLDAATGSMASMTLSPSQPTTESPISTPYYQEFWGYNNRFHTDKDSYSIHPPQKAQTYHRRRTYRPLPKMGTNRCPGSNQKKRVYHQNKNPLPHPQNQRLATQCGTHGRTPFEGYGCRHPVF